MRCTKCGNELQGNAQFCNYCGAKVEINNTLHCPNCNAQLAPGTEFCPECGTRIQMNNTLHCPNCGTQIEPGAEFCGECGADLSGGGVVPPPVQNQAQSSGLKIAVIIAVIVAVLAVAGLAGFIVYQHFFNPDTETSDTHSDKDSDDDKDDDKDKGGKATARPTRTPSATTAAATPTPQPATPTPIPVPTAAPSNMYLFDSDRQYITNAYLDTKSREEVRLILNEMYARHGYIFQLEQYQTYFSAQSWYVPRYESDATAESFFNEYEKANKKTIVAYETAKGWR